MTTRKPPKKPVPQVNPVVQAAADQTPKRKGQTVPTQLELFPLTSVTRRKKR
ncbi:hypothetical protein [Nocardia salmonicida]|uniref:hypothetical protein n=1 Tax=Nocardia salmonicida TaxID=53431 RepID=UPI000A8D2531